MSETPATVGTAPIIYATVMSACAEKPELQDRLVADFAATMRSQFGIEIAQPSSLARTTTGFRLALGDDTYDLGRPEDFNRSELSDSELELVSGGQNGPACPAPAFDGSAPYASREDAYRKANG